MITLIHVLSETGEGCCVGNFPPDCGYLDIFSLGTFELNAKLLYAE